MEIILLAIGLFLIIAGLSFFIVRTQMRRLKQKPPPKNSSLSSCPLCSSPLDKGENIFTRVYRPMTVADQRCIVNGCPHCFPDCERGVRRICPVCSREVPQDGHLVSRLFNKAGGKKHIIVVGCSVCLNNASID